MYPDKMKYPDSMLVRHLEAQVDRILDYDFGSIVSDSEYRMIGKTKKIIQKLYLSILENGIESRKNVVFVGHRSIQDLYVEELLRLASSSPLLRDDISRAKLKGIVIDIRDDVRGHRFDNDTKIIFLDGVPKDVYKEVIMPTVVSKNIVFRGFYS